MGMGRRSKESLVSQRLTTPFQKYVFAAAIKSLAQLNNPLRANNFATGLRELSRILLDDLAPDAEVKECEWFKPELPQGRLTRAQRVRYAIQAGLPDNFVRKTLKVDVDKTIKKLTKLVENLNALTHINQKTFGMSKVQTGKFVNESLDVFISMFDTIDDCRERIRERLITKANQAIDQELISDVVDAFEEIATHYTVYGADLEDFDIAQMDSQTLIFDAEGYVNCTLQYGSDGDVERGDGVRRDDSYPLACKLVADITSPLDIEVQNLHVDNSSFYE